MMRRSLAALVTGAPKPRTASANGHLWGARARDWSEVQEGMLRPVYEAVFDRAGVGAGRRVLDLGCGSGMAAQLAASRGADVAGVDAAAELLAIARTRVPSGDFRLGDIEELTFVDRVFDVVTGFNAFQYADDPVAALVEARRVAVRDGTIAIVTWGSPDGMDAASLLAAIRPLMPSPPPGAPGAFALSDEVTLRRLAADAGLVSEAAMDIECPFVYPDEITALRGLNSSGLAARAIENAGERAVTAAHARAIAPFRRADGSYLVNATFRCLIARA